MPNLVNVNFKKSRSSEMDKYYDEMKNKIFDLIINDKKLDNTDKQCILYGVITRIVTYQHNKNLLEGGIGCSHINFYNAMEKIRIELEDPNDCLW